MVILDTVVHETIWGGEKLSSIIKSKSEKIGHLYSLCCEKGLENHIINGEYKGKPFQDYFIANRDKFNLSQYNEFPLIIALVEANDNLSIQVHPDDVVAFEEERAAYGKNESWIFFDAPENGTIFNGCLENDKEVVKQKIENNELMSVVDRLPVKTGEYVYVEAGTMHALSKGAFLYEIEENSPWTYRMYDFDRIGGDGKKRQLHITKALKALKTNLKSKAIPFEDEIIEERRYCLRKIKKCNEYHNESNTLECVTMIKGECIADGVITGIGTTIVLEPDEKIFGKFDYAIMARPK